MADDFGYLGALDPRGKTALFDFRKACRGVKIPGDPVLEVYIATQDNPAYWNDRLRATVKEAGPEDAADLFEAFQKDPDEPDRLARTVVKAWPSPPLNADGKPSEFNPENVAAFLRNLPRFILDTFRAFCLTPSNFVRACDIPSEEAIEEKQGN